MGCAIAATLDFTLQYVMSWGMLNYVDKIPTEFDDFGKIKENISAISVIGSCAGGFFGFDKNTFHLSLAVASGVEITLRKLIKNHNSQTTSQIEDDNYIEILELVKDNWKVIGYDILTGSVIAFIAQKGAAAYGPKTSNFISVKLKKYIDSHFGKTIIEVNNKLAKKITNFTKEHVDNAVNYVKNRVIVKGAGKFSITKLDDYLKNISTRNPAGAVGSPPRVYQESVTTGIEYELKGGANSKIWADGLD
ncbi:MAG: hypothetical protein KA313_09735, partial [Pseudarcicella sp.]|nr:hypothetical protein [Pseudarcicella sp.]